MIINPYRFGVATPASFDLISWVGDNASTRAISTTVDLSGGGWILVYSSTAMRQIFSTDGSSVYTTDLGASAVTLSGFASTFTNGSFSTQGATINATGITYYAAVFKKSAGFCDVLTYTGTGSATTINHGLGQTPQFLHVIRNSGSLRAYREQSQANNVYFVFTSNSRLTGTTYWNNAAMTSSAFPVGTSTDTNGNGVQYWAIALGNQAGISNHGTYTGTAGSVTVSTGLVPDWFFGRIISTTATSQNVMDTIRTPGWSGDETSLNPFAGSSSNVGDVLQISGSDLVSGTSGNVVNSSAPTYFRLALKKG